MVRVTRDQLVAALRLLAQEYNRQARNATGADRDKAYRLQYQMSVTAETLVNGATLEVTQ